ncbi:16S rRNA (cytosine(967)-C(5))-methyltransferase RsmB [Paenibacillus sediminis]|uniref:16S rRNA (cytosine(967)-C(5))-methyltransferase n=1 Tax=Paenibacillus sediminis TaxID=664909 RepID=A0ABS4GZ70_9BACL|nr:16S rRNA (cytosine967-C5)-methyltransferase [Paenibacillus sediminis]
MSGKSYKVKGTKPTARETALDVLTKVEEEGAYSNLLLNQYLQYAELSKADAGLATELVYGTISRLNTIDYFLDTFVNKGVRKLQPWVRGLLRLSFYQLHYLDRIPAHAAVNEAVNIAKRRGHQGISGMVNGVLRNVLRRKDELVLPDNLPVAKRIALEHSHPEWLVARWIKQYGEETAEEICKANNEPPAVSVRVNTLKTNRDALMEQMTEAGCEVVPSTLSKDGIVVLSGGNMALTNWYKQGLFSIQDESSMLVAERVAPQPGMRVLDCCAAPGGKTTHMAEKMNDEGQIIANDVHPHKKKLIDEQVKRLGLTSVETTVSDALTLAKQYAPQSFDRILLDAPCSGFGVIRRKPDLKWAKTPEDIKDISALQYELLQSVSTLLRPEGVLVYSTCTIEKDENEAIVNRFIEEHPQFKATFEQILPHQHHSDGFFIARIQKA